MIWCSSLVLPFLFLGASQALYAQRFAVNENQKVLKNLTHDVYVSGDGRYLELSFADEDDKISDPVITAYDAKLKEKYTQPLPEIAGNAYITGMYSSGKLYFFVMQPDPDGSKMILFDIDGWHVTDSHFAPTSTGPGKVSYSQQINSTGNLYVVKISPSGEPEWIRVMGKNQIQGDIRTFLGKIRIADSKHGIHIFFLDYDGNEHPETFRKTPTSLSSKTSVSLFAVSITSNGKMSKKTVIGGAGNDFRFSPERSLATGGQRSLLCFNESKINELYLSSITKTRRVSHRDNFS